MMATPSVSKGSRHLSRAVLLAGVCGAGIALFAARAWRAHPHAPATDDAAEAPAEQAAAGGELAALRRRLARLEGEAAARGQATGHGLRDEAADVQTKAARQQLQEKVRKYYTPELEAKRFVTYFDGLDQVRRAEGVDAPWSTAIQTGVTRALAGGGSIATLAARSVECGRTLCRVELDAKDEGLKAAAVGELLQSMAGELPTASVHVPVGSGHVTAYFARPGTELPAMETPEALVADLP